MNREHLKDALGSISDQHIAEAASAKKRNYLPYIGAIAACLILVFALFFPKQENGTAPITMENKPSVTVSEEALPADRFPAEEFSPSLPTTNDPAISSDQSMTPKDDISTSTELPKPGMLPPPEQADSSETVPDETEEETDPDDTEPSEPETTSSD